MNEYYVNPTYVEQQTQQQNFNETQFLPEVVISLVQARFIEVPATHPLTHRPLQFYVNDSLINQLQIATAGGMNISAASLVDIAPKIISPAPEPIGELAIMNGWGNSRFSVFLLFHIETAGRVYEEVICGYTDELGIMPGTNTIDDNMRFFVNSHMRISHQNKITQQGMRTGLLAEDNVNVLKPIMISTPTSPTGFMQFDTSLRPMDIYHGLQRTHVDQGHSIIDVRGSISVNNSSKAGIASDRTNTLSANYLSKLMAGWAGAAATMSNESHWNNSNSFMASAAAGTIRETDLSGHALFNVLNQYTSYKMSGSFSLGELKAANVYVNYAGIEAPVWLPRGQGSILGDSHTWGDTSLTTQIAHKLTHAVPSAGNASMLSFVTFNAFGMGNQHICVPQHSRNIFPSQSDHVWLNRFVTLMQSQILPQLFGGICQTYVLDVTYAVGGTVDIKINLDNVTGEIPYSGPNYCDPMSAGTYAGSLEDVNAIARSVSELMTRTFVQDASSVAGMYGM